MNLMDLRELMLNYFQKINYFRGLCLGSFKEKVSSKSVLR